MTSPPSAWIARFAPIVPRGGRVLDVACGAGRHLRLFLALGHAATGVDIDLAGVADLAGRAELVKADIEGGPWPFAGRRFSGIVVANYLHRPLLPVLAQSLEPGGILLYETFARGNARFGRPSSPAFLLGAGELLELARGRLAVIAYEHGEVASPRAAVVQRLAAVFDPVPVAALGGDAEPRALPAAVSG